MEDPAASGPNLHGVARAVLSLVVSALVLLATPAAAQTESVATSDGDRLQHLTLSGTAVGTVDVRVLLPAGYHDPARRRERYPVLYLLHGASGDSGDWVEQTDVEQLTAPHELIVVMPDGGATGFYSDWLDGPAWETFHIEELVPRIDETYRTISDRQGRAVAGLSMGGYGAMVYAARHPDLFVAAASFSGALDIADGHLPAAIALDLLGLQASQRWGPFATQEIVWRDHNPPDLADNLRWTRLDVFAGNGVPRPSDDPAAGFIEGGTYVMSSGFHTRLELAGVEHGWHDYGPGTHEWHYWQADLHAWFPTLLATFADPPPDPEAFDYRTAEPTFSVYGWSFDVHRPAQEFLELRAVSTEGFTARGSGRVAVTTPPAYQRGRRYEVTAVPGPGVIRADDVAATLSDPEIALPTSSAAGPDRTTVVTAGSDGRLRFALDLGPGHPFRQYTLDANLATAADPAGYWAVRTVEIAPSHAAPRRPPGSSLARRTAGPTKAASPVAPASPAARSTPGEPRSASEAAAADVDPRTAIASSPIASSGSLDLHSTTGVTVAGLAALAALGVALALLARTRAS